MEIPTIWNIFGIIILCFSFHLFAGSKPIISVPDFTTARLSKSEMKTIISFLSPALFKTGKFAVIDLQERERILGEIEFSVSGCTDESCCQNSRFAFSTYLA